MAIQSATNGREQQATPPTAHTGDTIGLRSLHDSAVGRVGRSHLWPPYPKPVSNYTSKRMFVGSSYRDRLRKRRRKRRRKPCL